MTLLKKRRRPVYPLGLSVGSVSAAVVSSDYSWVPRSQARGGTRAALEPLDGAGNRGPGIPRRKPRAWRSARVSIMGTCIGHLSLVNKASNTDNRNSLNEQMEGRHRFWSEH